MPITNINFFLIKKLDMQWDTPLSSGEFNLLRDFAMWIAFYVDKYIKREETLEKVRFYGDIPSYIPKTNLRFLASLSNFIIIILFFVIMCLMVYSLV